MVPPVPPAAPVVPEVAEPVVVRAAVDDVGARLAVLPPTAFVPNRPFVEVVWPFTEVAQMSEIATIPIAIVLVERLNIQAPPRCLESGIFPMFVVVRTKSRINKSCLAHGSDVFED